MYQWIDGNNPQDKDLYYWITMRGLTSNETYPIPCKYDKEKDCWIDTDNNKISVHAVVAYYPIIKPKAYKTIGTGCGYYIRANYKNEGKDMIYGFGLQPANWAGRGYNTVDKAKSAAKRLKKLDEKDGYERESYEVLNSDSEVVWKII